MKEYTRKTVGYYDRIADSYVETTAAVVLKDKLDMFTKFLPGTRILDVACGPGHDTDYLTGRSFDAQGIDLSEEMIRIARSRHAGKFAVMDFFAMSFPQNSFDGIWCSSALVHVTPNDLPQLLGDFGKALVPNGILGVITVEQQKVLRDVRDTREYVMYSKEELEKQLRQTGYNILVSNTFSYGGKDRLFLLSRNKK